jgi:hypothetical protein
MEEVRDRENLVQPELQVCVLDVVIDATTSQRVHHLALLSGAAP